MLTQKPRVPIAEILATGWMPSPLKKLVYRLRGYRIGRGVRIGLGSVVCGKKVVIGDYAEIGFMTILRGTTIKLGSHVKVGATTFLDTPHLDLGDESRINEQVFIGGLQDHDARFVLGKRSQIFQLCYINPSRSITVGDDSAIGGHSLVFGHASWLSELDGYPVTFAPIEIGNRVSLSWRVFVLPGVTIGDGTVVGANSLVNKSLPGECLAVGFPARVVARRPYFPRAVSDPEKERLLRRILGEMLQFLRGHECDCREQGSLVEIVQRRRRWGFPRLNRWRMWVEYGGDGQPPFAELPKGLHAYVSLRAVPLQLRQELAARQTVWIDIESRQRASFGNDLAEEVVMYLRRHGLRFER